LLVTDLDPNTESVHLHGKCAKDRRVRFGPMTALAISRYLRARHEHQGAALPNCGAMDLVTVSPECEP
jgi:site-specific recombinase XerD